MSLSNLPTHILLEIVGQNVDVCFYLVHALPKFGRLSLNLGGILQRQLTIRHVEDDQIIYTLLGRLHRYEGPAYINIKTMSMMWYSHGNPKRGTLWMQKSDGKIWKTVWNEDKTVYATKRSSTFGTMLRWR
jgi:hypothetical protein